MLEIYFIDWLEFREKICRECRITVIHKEHTLVHFIYSAELL